MARNVIPGYKDENRYVENGNGDDNSANEDSPDVYSDFLDSDNFSSRTYLPARRISR